MSAISLTAETAGTHANSAFALTFALEYARATAHQPLHDGIRSCALEWFGFGNDRNSPASYEPSGADFLSPTLVEAVLMLGILDAPAFAAWLESFVPGFAGRSPAS